MAKFNTRRAPLERPDDPLTPAEFHQAIRRQTIRLSGIIIAVTGIGVAIVKLA